jgi:putative Ca2+/H+ antiporter (TMEM165/GDT1 family)
MKDQKCWLIILGELLAIVGTITLSAIDSEVTKGLWLPVTCAWSALVVGILFAIWGAVELVQENRRNKTQLTPLALILMVFQTFFFAEIGYWSTFGKPDGATLFLVICWVVVTLIDIPFMGKRQPIKTASLN